MKHAKENMRITLVIEITAWLIAAGLFYFLFKEVV
jgi:hypothetical protein